MPPDPVPGTRAHSSTQSQAAAASPSWPGPTAPVRSEPPSVGNVPCSRRTVRGSPSSPGRQAPGAPEAAASGLCFSRVSAAARTEPPVLMRARDRRSGRLLPGRGASQIVFRGTREFSDV